MKVIYDTPTGEEMHLFDPAAPTRLTSCGLWVKPGEADPPVLKTVPASDVTYLARLAPRGRVCAACAEQALRRVTADYERLRALKRDGRVK